MLVSNRIDDTAAIPGVGSDESGLGVLGPTKSGGFSWRRADRTHQIALGGTVGVTYAFDQVGGEIVELGNVIVRSSIKSHVNILNAPNGLVDSGVGVVRKYTVFADFRRANEQYAQVGVRLLMPTVAENVPWPANVNLSDGLYSATPTGEMAALLVTAKLFTQATDDIELYYVNFGAEIDAKGLSFIEADEARGLPNGFKDNIVIFKRDYTTFTLPHEIGHVLTNSKYHWIEMDEGTNLMHGPTTPDDSLNATKRLIQDQDDRIHSQRPNLLG